METAEAASAILEEVRKKVINFRRSGRGGDFFYPPRHRIRPVCNRAAEESGGRGKGERVRGKSDSCALFFLYPLPLPLSPSPLLTLYSPPSRRGVPARGRGAACC